MSCTTLPVSRLIQRRHELFASQQHNLKPFQPQAHQRNLNPERQCNCDSRMCPPCVFKRRSQQEAALLRVCEQAQHHPSWAFTVNAVNDGVDLRGMTKELLRRTRRLMKAMNSDGHFFTLHHGQKNGLHLHGLVMGQIIPEQKAIEELGSNFHLSFIEATRNVFDYSRYIIRAERVLDDFADVDRWLRIRSAWFGLARYEGWGSLACTGHAKKKPARAKVLHFSSQRIA